MDVARDEKTRWVGVAFGLVLASFAAFQQFKLPPVLPIMLSDYHYDLVLAGGFMSIYALVGLLTTLPLSRVIAAGRAVTALWCGLACFVLGTLLVLAVPQSGWVVLAGRALEGLGFSILALVGPASAGANAARRHLPLVAAMSACWVPVGQMTAALLSLPTQDAGLWRPVWWIGIAASLAMAIWLVGMQRSRSIHLGAGNAGAGRKTVLLTGEERQLLWVAGIGFLLFSGQYIGFMTWFPDYMVKALASTPEVATYAYLVPVLLVATFNLLSASLMRRGVTAAGLLIIGFALEAVCWWFLPSVGEGLWGVVLLIAYGIGAGLVPTGLFAMPGTIVGPQGATLAAFGIMLTLRNIGVLAGPMLLAAMIGSAGGWRLAAPVFCLLNLLALVLTIWLGRRLAHRRRTPEPA